jgi:LAS superfamily LD-carboxypeptidase LdcB
LTADFAATPAGRWLAEHAHEYGFVISYPDGATAVTCYEFEPWHLRYVGRENAAAVVDSGVPLREWLFDRASADDSSG